MIVVFYLLKWLLITAQSTICTCNFLNSIESLYFLNTLDSKLNTIGHFPSFCQNLKFYNVGVYESCFITADFLTSSGTNNLYASGEYHLFIRTKKKIWDSIIEIN